MAFLDEAGLGTLWSCVKENVGVIPLLDVTGDSGFGSSQTFTLAEPITNYRQIIVCFENFFMSAHTTTPNIYWAFSSSASSSSPFKFNGTVFASSGSTTLQHFNSAVYTLNNTYTPVRTFGSHTLYSGRLLQGSLSHYGYGSRDATSGLEHVFYAQQGSTSEMSFPDDDKISVCPSVNVIAGYRIFVGGIK